MAGGVMRTHRPLIDHHAWGGSRSGEVHGDLRAEAAAAQEGRRRRFRLTVSRESPEQTPFDPVPVSGLYVSTTNDWPDGSLPDQTISATDRPMDTRPVSPTARSENIAARASRERSFASLSAISPWIRLRLPFVSRT